MTIRETVQRILGIPTQRMRPAMWDDDFMRSWVSQSATGIDVTPASSLQNTAVFACVRILAESVASLPLILYRRLGDGGKERATNHCLYGLLHDLPNPEMTSMQLRETLVGHLALWGNAYCEIEYSNGGYIRGLWPLRPDKTAPNRIDGELVYVVKMPIGPDQVLARENVMHIAGLGYDGVVGHSVITLARQAIGLALATEQFGATFFGNGAWLGGTLSYPGKLSPEALERLRDSFQNRHGGLTNALRLGLLEEGVTYESIGVPPEDAQFLATREFQLLEIARMFRISPHLLGDLSRATFSNIEHLGLEFVTYTLRPWLVRWEQAIHRDLLTQVERKSLFAEHLVDGLLRGDIAGRYAAYATARQNGWLSANDIRAFENMNPVDGGDVYLIPLNMIPADQAGAMGAMSAIHSLPLVLDTNGNMRPLPEIEQRLVTKELTCGPAPEIRARDFGRSRLRIARSAERLMQDGARRVIKREIADVRRAIRKFMGKRDLQSFNTWLDEFYKEHQDVWEGVMLPILLSYADQVGANVADELRIDAMDSNNVTEFIQKYATNVAIKQTTSSILQLKQLLEQAVANGEDPVGAIDGRLDGWDSNRADIFGRDESRSSINAFAVAFFAAGAVATRRVIKMMWITNGDSCPYCMALDGMIVGIEEFFLNKNTALEPEGADRPFYRGSNISHGPLHGGCVAGNTAVSAGGYVAACSKRWFDGDMIIISTAAGNKLTCTPNHPILTGSGWIAASLLNKGHNVICSGDGQGKASGNMNYQDVPTSIEDIFESFGNDPEMMTRPMPVSAEDFHGDGMEGQVAIVRANCQLWNRGKVGQHDSKLAFGFRDTDTAPLSGLGGEALLREGLNSSSGGNMGGGRLSLAFGGGHLACPHLACVAAAADGDISSQQAPTNDIARNGEFISESILGLASDVFPDDVINIERYPFHGFVFNLQTEYEHYTANGIITHNCDCGVGAVME